MFEIEIKIKLLIYYKNKKVNNLLMKNNLTRENIPEECKSGVVYEFKCQEGECKSLNNSYIGLTTCTLKERLTGHRYKGSIFAHYRLKHQKSPEVDELIKSTRILYHESNPFQLSIYEALHIRRLKPALNENLSDFNCLKLNIF